MVVDVINNSLLSLSPILGVFLVGFLICVIMGLVNKKTLGTEHVKEVKKKLQDLREKMLEAQKSGDSSKANEYVKQMLIINSKYMKFMMKPMMISLLLVILILPFIRGAYSGMTVAIVPKTIPVIGGIGLSWFWWYFIVTFVLSLIIRKIIGI